MEAVAVANIEIWQARDLLLGFLMRKGFKSEDIYVYECDVKNHLSYYSSVQVLGKGILIFSFFFFKLSGRNQITYKRKNEEKELSLKDFLKLIE